MASVLQTPVGPNMWNMYYQLDVNTESWARYSRGELTSDEFFLPGKDRIDVPHNKYEENEELPILYLAASADTKDGKEALITKMVEAAEKWGFFGMVNHGVSLELRRRLEAHAQEFFNLPMEQKLKGGRDQELKYGYAAGSPKFLPKKNWHEMLQLSWNPAQLEPFFHRVQSQEYDCENMRADILEYTAAMGELGRKILALLAEGLGLNPDEIKKHFRAESNSVLRVNHYPPYPHPDKIEGIHPHSDPNLITILHQDNVGGLQILKDGKWIAIQPNPETLIVNIGDILMMISNERFKSAKHRAITNSNKSRVSLVFFCEPADDDILIVPEKLTDSTHPAKFVPFTWKEMRVNIYCPNRMNLYRCTTTPDSSNKNITQAFVERNETTQF